MAPVAAALTESQRDQAPVVEATEPKAAPPLSSGPVAEEAARERMDATGVGTGEDAEPMPFNEAAESAYLAEARARGELAPPPVAQEDAVEPPAGSLPRVEELVDRIPVGVREVLDELFRARYVAVKVIPKKVLEGSRSASVR